MKSLNGKQPIREIIKLRMMHETPTTNFMEFRLGGTGGSNSY